MADLSWYWHRLRAMSPGEVALHVRKKLRQHFDARRQWDLSGIELECSGVFPKLPRADVAPTELRDALRRDADDILAGRWKAFGHLELQVDDPPKWHKDYLAGKDLATDECAFKLNYRELPDGADIKLIWELNRWYQLVRLAMAAYVLGDGRAAEKCVEWLENWVKHNPPYRGWNWTSALEVGMRLVQFTWIDALLSAESVSGFEVRVSSKESALRESVGPPSPPGEGRGEGGRNPRIKERMERLRREILPPHVCYAWRHKSFGSSANNHLIGELTGLILATVRWPTLAQWGAPLNELQGRWEHEVLAQFGEDGGNKEQALNYHLFSWEFCWQAFNALEGAGRKVAGHVQQRLSFAARFFWEVQARNDHWDYGDSDDAFVSPIFLGSAVREWHQWFESPRHSVSLNYWLSEPESLRWMPPVKQGIPLNAVEACEWWLYPRAGIAIHESGFWWLRWDGSPLGYLSTAAHGHLDALHLSIWYKGVALIVDPGTGAYYGDRRLRNWLASRAAHNTPCPKEEAPPRRLGSFLWASDHSDPTLTADAHGATAVLKLTGMLIRRRIVDLPNGAGWRVEDDCIGKDGRYVDFTTRWQFPPGSWVKQLDARKFSVHRADVAMTIEVAESWAAVELVEPVGKETHGSLMTASVGSLEGIVSPAFRKTAWAPYLKLVARPQGDKPCVFSTTFLASAGA